MRPKSRDLARIKAVTEAALLAQQARLAAINREEERLKALLDEIDEARNTRRAELHTGLDEAARAGADPLWQQWADGRRVSLNQEMAKLRVVKEDIRSDIARAFGRDSVTERLVSDARHAERIARQKRQDQTS